ncbi:MAG: hypothetical protein LPK06_07665 [Marinobacter sp.]|nr:hypothetical protein [Marinobacter sp.]
MTHAANDRFRETVGAFQTLRKAGNTVKFPLDIMAGLLDVKQRSEQIDEQKNRQHQ